LIQAEDLNKTIAIFKKFWSEEKESWEKAGKGRITVGEILWGVDGGGEAKP